MEKFKTNVAIHAESLMDAQAKKNAMEKLSQQLNTKELHALADLLKNDPMKKELAKKYLGIN